MLRFYKIRSINSILKLRAAESEPVRDLTLMSL